MEYLTANETALKWNISNRMVAYYCKTGRISGVLKKGKTWLLPAYAEKPIDNRFTKNKIVVEDNPELQGALNNINKMDTDNNTIYRTNDLYKNLGLTRETLRYYEEMGLIMPERNQNSQYREFTFADVAHLMAIDFYKKRGFSPFEIQKLMQSKNDSYVNILDQKITDIENNIRMQQRIVKRLIEAKSFCEAANISEKIFSIKDLPLYFVAETFDAVSSLNEYKERVLDSLDLQEEDILTNLVRAVTFDQSGYKGTKMCIIKQATKKEQGVGKTYLESGKCLHTVLEADSHDDSLMEKMFLSAYEWARENQQSFKGVVYIFIRFVALSGQTERNLYEVWIPLK